MSDGWNWDDDITQGENDTKEYKEIAEGKHIAKLEKAEAAETKGGTPYLNIQWRINGGDFNNYCAFQKIWATEKARNMYKMNMSKLEIKEQLADLQDTGEILTRSAKLLNAKELHAEIYINYKDSDDGQYRNQNVMINDLFKGSVREDGIVNHAPVPAFESDEELPF
jgi:hypothetical protein